MEPLIIQMQSIDAKQHRYRQYEMWVYPENGAMITRWGRIGRSWQKLKRQHHTQIEELEKNIKKIIKRRLDHSYHLNDVSGDSSHFKDLTAMLHIPSMSSRQLSLF